MPIDFSKYAQPGSEQPGGFNPADHLERGRALASALQPPAGR
jgi:hypothetical protein